MKNKTIGLRLNDLIYTKLLDKVSVSDEYDNISEYVRYLIINDLKESDK